MLNPGGFSNQVIFFPENLYLSYPGVPEINFLFLKNCVYVYLIFYWHIYFSVVLWDGVSYIFVLPLNICSHILRQR